MKRCFQLLLLLFFNKLAAQELYVYTEPASNMPARSISGKLTNKFVRQKHSRQWETRQSPEIMLGLNKHLMLHAGISFSNMYSSAYRWESAKFYAKYRFLSKDELYHHFRMAAFAEASYSRNNMLYQELSLEGDQSGVQAGIIATQLLHRLALSTTVSVTEVLNSERKNKHLVPANAFEALNYSVSAGYLLLPKEYKDYTQTNVNLYAELLGQQALDNGLNYLDLAVAAQLIFNSQVKVNAGYRWQLNGNMHRMANNSFLVGVEWLFLNFL